VTRETIRIVIADDHPLVRSGIRAMLAEHDGLVLVGEAVDAVEARSLCLDLRPDILLLDLSMPGPPASETVAYLGAHCPDVRVLVLTAYDDEAYVRGLIAAGVRGYVLKDELPEAIVRALHAVMRGDTWFSLPMLSKLALDGTLEAHGSTGIELTPREMDILRRIVQGRTDRQISEEMYLSERSVRYSLRRIYDKLGVSTRVQAAAQAAQLGLVRVDPDQ
jgi:DNA-binding NarL/FixJ family response regulator